MLGIALQKVVVTQNRFHLAAWLHCVRICSALHYTVLVKATITYAHAALRAMAH